MFDARDHTFAVCAYKENPYLESTVQSLLNQSMASSVIISTSTPNAYIETVAQKLDVPMVVNPNPHYAGDDWNYAYDAADTPLVTVAHQDDYYESGFAAAILGAANQYDADELQVLFTDYYEIRDGERVDSNMLLAIKRMMNSPFKHAALNGSRFVKKRVLSFGNPVCCPAMTMVKRNLGPSVFDTTLRDSCDYKTLVELAFRGGRFVYVPQRLVGHRIYAGSATSKNLGEGIRQPENVEIMSMLWPPSVARAIARVYALSEKSNRME